eukprot:288950-Pleurochrysis_carterae.AAC.1
MRSVPMAFTPTSKNNARAKGVWWPLIEEESMPKQSEASVGACVSLALLLPRTQQQAAAVDDYTTRYGRPGWLAALIRPMAPRAADQHHEILHNITHSLKLVLSIRYDKISSQLYTTTVTSALLSSSIRIIAACLIFPAR